MSDLLVTKQILKDEFENKMLNGQKVYAKDPVSIVDTSYGANIPKNGSLMTAADITRMNTLKNIARTGAIVLSGKYLNGFEYNFKGRGSILDRVKKGVFSTGNTLNDNWADLVDAARLHLTIRKEARPTLRQFIYTEINMPGATKDVRPTELFPYGVVFEENNGEGEAVRQGQNLGGQYDTVPMKIYAAGFVWTLLASLFDDTYDLSRLLDGVALAYSAKKDDLALAPIIGGTYTGAKATAASTVGTLRQELLMNTLMNAVDGLSNRTDPVTKRKITGEGLVLLCATEDARHVNHVISGLNPAIPDKYTALSSISRVVGYDGEVIDMPNETVTYTGCTKKTAFLIKRNRYFSIPIKRNLIMELDQTPNVSTLSREQRAWYFAEAMFNSSGISSFVQKVTLPAW